MNGKNTFQSSYLMQILAKVIALLSIIVLDTRKILWKLKGAIVDLHFYHRVGYHA